MFIRYEWQARQGRSGDNNQMYKDDILTTESMLRDSIVSMIIDGDKVIRDLFKHKDVTLVPTNKVDAITYKYVNDRVFVQIPDNLHEIEDFNTKAMLSDIENNLATYIRKAIRENTDLSYDVLNENTTSVCTFNEFKYSLSKEDKEELEENELAAGGSGEIDLKEYDKDAKYEYEDTEWELDKDTQNEVNRSDFMSDKEHTMDDTYKDMARKLVKSFKGYQGRLSTTNPTKRLRNKAIASELSDKIYENKRAMNGKKLENVNFMIDMSGSMSGEPIRNAMEILLTFNHIAKAGYLTGHIIYSETHKRCMIPMPVQDSLLKKMYSTGEAEGLQYSLKKYINTLKDSSILFCITDGQICDEPIDKNLYSRYKFKTVGVYVNSKAKDLSEYTGSLNRWFDISLVRRDVPSLIDKIINLSLRAK